MEQQRQAIDCILPVGLCKAQKRRFAKIPICVTLGILAATVFLLSLVLGRYGIPLPQIAAVFSDKLFGLHDSYPSTLDSVLFDIRIPRIAAAMLVGWALAGSGTAYQGLFKNPMISPDILGASAGAGFGAAFAILLSLSNTQTQIMAFGFGLLSVFLSYTLSSVFKTAGDSCLILVLTGMVVQAIFTSLQSVAKFVADPENKLPAITFWLMGSLDRVVGMSSLLQLLIPVAIGSVPLLLLRWRLNVLAFGEEEAKAMGVNTRALRLVIILSSTLLTASAVAISGMVGWVGLVVPHIARMLVGPNHHKLMPVAMLIGGIFLMVVDDVARAAMTVEIPLGILTSLIGAPFFLYLLLRRKKGWVQ